MSEREPSLSRAVQELSAKVATWESELAAWPPAVGESVGRALETAAERAEERSRSETATWRAAMQTQVTHLTELTAKQGQQHAALGRLIERQEQVLVPWWLRWIRAEWRAVILALLVGLLVGGGGTTALSDVRAAGPGADEISRDVGGDDSGGESARQQADPGGGRRPVADAAGQEREAAQQRPQERSQEHARQLIAAGQERAQAQKRGQERARQLIAAGQERLQEEKRERARQQKLERERERAQRRARERDDFDRER